MRHLSEEDSGKIAQLISIFRGIITWKDVIDLGEEITRERYSRQTLEKKDDIRTAYEVVTGKALFQETERHSKKKKSKELMAADQRISRLVGENERLEAVNAKLREQFVVWAENARKKGLTEADLNNELPKIDRRSNQERGI